MNKRSTTSANLAQRRRRAALELRELQATQKPRSTKAELYQHAEARLRAQQKGRRSDAGEPKTVSDPRRLLHQLEVHQIELELQNAELRQVRDDLEAALENYTDLYDFAPVGYFTLTPAGTIRQVNLTGAHLVGFERSLLLGQPLAKLIAATQRSIFNSYLKQVFAGEDKLSIEIELVGGKQPFKIVRVSAQRPPGGLDCRLVMVDITGSKREEDKVRVSETRYRRLFEAAHDGVLLLDPGTRKITDANPFMTQLLGYSHDQLVGKELFELGLLKDEAASRKMFEQLKKKHEVRYEDLPLETQAGRHQEVEVVANLYAENGRAVIQCNIRDITERTKAAAAQRRLEVVAATNRKLELEIARREVVEESLRESEQQQTQLLAQSRSMQEQLRHLSRQVLQAQEEERKRISRELHDVIAQTLTGINIRLATLKKGAGLRPENFDRDLELAQKLVENAVNVVHQFARELRPAVLDDLGLIPALHSFLKNFTAQTGVHSHLTAFAGLEELDASRRTILYRVAQEALTNVARHAQASRVEVTIQKQAGGICMKINDDGRSFNVEQRLRGKGGKRLGLLGMRERLEMVGGRFEIASAPGQGTTVTAEIPLAEKEPD
jgi:PAS domain S-box-containing protein